MKKASLLILFCSLVINLIAEIKTDYTSTITNPSFESGDASGWTWEGTTNYTWVGVNSDGDNTKTGTYIAGIWNESISDINLYQNISNLPIGMYQLTADLMGSNNTTTSRLTTQRVFANNSTVLFGSKEDYSADNLSVLGKSAIYSFGENKETQSDTGPFLTLSLTVPVTDSTLIFGVKTNGKSSTLGYSFPNLTEGNGHGWFKVDNFTLTYMGPLTDEVKSNAQLLNINIENGSFSPAFNADTTSYTVTLPVGTETVTPNVITAISGITITGAEMVDLSSGSGVSTIGITSYDGNTTITYTINYKIKKANIISGNQQDKLYTNEFALEDVTLLEGPFKNARDLNIKTLLQYDVDRLLASYRAQAGLTAKAESYSNWSGLDGHIGGHYLSALAINYAATGDTTCKRLMDYMVNELHDCQQAYATNNSTWGIGYAGGVPSSAGVWSTFKDGDFTNFKAAWVPWYNLHKTYAGLRDAWLYGNNDTAKTVFLAFCDWAIEITSNLSDAEMQTMLDVEPGGINEVFADAYQMTGLSKYLTIAKRLSHNTLLNSLVIKKDNLDNMHANTQVAKAVGFQRIAEVSEDNTYLTAGEFFWETVTNNRTLALGGNSRAEYFPATDDCKDYVEDVEGPESCNTYNMLKLTEDLFRINPQAKYVDFYERALYNHILSTQNPEHGGYVYFTPARPRHYRVYSTPGEAMWCCVGTGMENHGKYGEFIYTHKEDSLYLNLFIASELNWEDKGITVRQETTFPNEEQTKLIISTENPTNFNLKIRSPYWVKAGALKIVINNDTLAVLSEQQTYISVNRTWHNNDSVRIILPMHNTYEELPHVDSYIALMHGPILLGAETGTEDLAGLVADDSRWGHIANGEMLALNEAPILVSSRDSISSHIIAEENNPMHFKLKNLVSDSSYYKDLELQPFYTIHDARYMMYWLSLSSDEYQDIINNLKEDEDETLGLESRTIDQIAPGEQQPEADHNLAYSNSETGSHEGEFWRDASNGGYVSYEMSTESRTDLTLMVRYWGNESGNRQFYIKVDGTTIATENAVGKWNVDDFVNVEYNIPASLLEGKDKITVRFEAINTTNYVGGLFYLRLLKPKSNTAMKETIKTTGEYNIYTQDLNVFLTDLPTTATNITAFDISGRCVSTVKTYNTAAVIPFDYNGVKILKIESDDIINIGKVILY